MSKQWNPLQDLMLLQDRMNRLFEDVTERRTRDAGDDLETADWYPAADVYERTEEYLIAVDLPGIDRSALKIDIDEDRLVIKGKRPVMENGPNRPQRPTGTFLKAFKVPGSVDKNQINAQYKDGVLEVRLPKLKEQKAKRITINVS